jgi:LCP family protein required for cell wall assembly
MTETAVPPNTPTPRYRLRKGRITAIVLLVFLFAGIIVFFASFRFSGRAVSGNPDTANDNDTGIVSRVQNFIEQAPDVIAESWSTDLKHENKLTGILLVGIDARNVVYQSGEFENTKPEGAAGTRNSDAIMQVVYDHETGYAYMISIPRDMGIDINLDCLKFRGSIFWGYDKGQSAGCPGGGVEVMKSVVENITGIKSQYHVFITMSAFKEFFEIAGATNDKGEKGFWVDNPEAFYERYPYNDYGWESVHFPKGMQFMNAERSLRYIRSRQYSYDWGRAKRQQIFIEAVAQQLLSTETLLNPAKLLNLAGLFRDKTDFSIISFGEIVEGIQMAREMDRNKVVNIVLGPEWMGHEIFLNRIPHGRPGPYYMVPTHWKQCPAGNEFCKVKDFIAKIRAYPTVYEETAKIYAYASSKDSSGKGNFANTSYQQLLNSPAPVVVNESKVISKQVPEHGIILIDYSQGSKPYTLSILSKYLGVTVEDGNSYPGYRFNNEDIAIIVR